jgi:hypothetical protein
VRESGFGLPWIDEGRTLRAQDIVNVPLPPFLK